MWMNEHTQLGVCKEMWRCVAYVETLLSKAFCNEVYPACSGASPTIQLFPQSPKHGGRIPHNSLLIQSFGRWVPVTLFVFVDVEVRLLEDQVVDDASYARSCAWREDIIHRFVALELSCDESSSDSVLSVVRPPQRVVTRFFPGATGLSTVSYTPESASRSSSCSLAFIVSSASAPSNKRVQQHLRDRRSTLRGPQFQLS